MKNIIFALFFILIALFYSPTVFAQTATLSLSPASGTFNKGCNFSLNIVLNTGQSQTDGTDAILIYDTSRFSAKSIASGTIYPDYPGNNIDEQTGKITVSGLASVSTPFTGSGILASINFQVLDTAQAGATQIKFDFDPNDKAKTTDSNVVERGTVVDILNTVTNGNYIVGTGSCTSTTPSPTPVPGRGGPGSGTIATPSARTTPISLDCAVNERIVNGKCEPLGAVELTYTVAILGSILTILGILGLALL